MNAITLQAVFQSARTTVDGGIRISFDIDGSQAEYLSPLIQLKDKLLFVVIQESNLTTEIKAGDFET